MSWFSSLIGGVSNFLGLSDVAKTAGGLIADSQTPQYEQQNKFQKDYFDYTFNRQAARQDSLNANQALVGKNSMLNAGLNPSMSAGGYSPNVTPTSGNAGTVTNGQSVLDILSSVMNLATNISQIKKNNSDIDNINADTESKSIQNVREHSYDASLTKYKNGVPYVDPDDGTIHFLGSDFENKGDFQAYYDALNNATNFITSLSNSNADVAQNKLRKAVAEGQLKSNAVLDAIINKPSAEFTKLKNEASKLWEDATDVRYKNKSEYWVKTVASIEKDMDFTDAQIDMLVFQKKLQTSENFIGLVDSIKDPNLSTGDKWAMVGAYFMNLLGKALGTAGNVVNITKRIK